MKIQTFEVTLLNGQVRTVHANNYHITLDGAAYFSNIIRKKTTVVATFMPGSFFMVIDVKAKQAQPVINLVPN